jgi:hypothetical protein
MLKSRPTPSASQLNSRVNQPSKSARATVQAWRAARLLIAPAALVATFAFSCSDDDESIVGPTGGSGGNGASGGSAGLGGSGGNGGSSVAGAAGSGGSAGSSAGAGGSAGNGNMAGAAGTAGVGNDPDAGDGGTDTDSGTVQLTPQQQAADAICVSLDAVASCPAPIAPCRDGVIAGWDGTKAAAATPGACDAEVDAYYNCLATDNTATFNCFDNGTAGDTSDDSPQIAAQAGGCQDEEAAMGTCLGG